MLILILLLLLSLSCNLLMTQCKYAITCHVEDNPFSNFLFKTNVLGHQPHHLASSMNTAQTKRPGGEGPFNDVRRRDRSWNVTTRRRSRRREAAAPSSEASGKKVTAPPPPPLMHVMKYTVPSVLVFATLQYQGKPQALLLENPAPMWCFVAAACVYWLVAGEMKQTPSAPTPTRFRIYRGVAVASAMLSGALLVSMLLPRPVPVWIPLSAGIILNAAFCLINYGGIKFVANRMHAPVVESPSTLPV